MIAWMATSAISAKVIRTGTRVALGARRSIASLGLYLMLGIVGDSGSGKTTITRGLVRVLGEDQITHLGREYYDET